MKEVQFAPVYKDRLDAVDLGYLADGVGMRTLTSCMRAFHPNLRVEKDPNLVVFDTETSGVDFAKDRMWEIGLYFPSTGIGLSLFPDIGYDAWAACDYEVDRRYKIACKTDPACSRQAIKDAFIADCQEHAMPPEEVFEVVRSVFNDWTWLAGHNCVRFDVPFLRTEMSKYGFKLNDPTNVVDTAMLVKAAKLGQTPLSSDQVPTQFYRRVANIRAKGVYFSIKNLSDEYKLVDALDFDEEKAHGAMYDSWVSCQLLRLLAGKAGLSETK